MWQLCAICDDFVFSGKLGNAEETSWINNLCLRCHQGFIDSPEFAAIMFTPLRRILQGADRQQAFFMALAAFVGRLEVLCRPHPPLNPAPWELYYLSSAKTE
jgi:hypothetical protein